MEKHSQINGLISKPFLRVYSFLLLIGGVGCLLFCVKLYFGDPFLRGDETIYPNRQVVEGLLKMVRSGFFGMIPAMSILLLISSILLWLSSRKENFNKR
jgi:hypothetical protein